VLRLVSEHLCILFSELSNELALSPRVVFLFEERPSHAWFKRVEKKSLSPIFRILVSKIKKIRASRDYN
jgi:hypothetical protein